MKKTGYSDKSRLPPDRERRSYAVELRAEGDGAGAGKLAGYAAVFDQWSEDLGGFRERIAPGAFAASIKADDIRALWNHDASEVLGRNIASTLRLSEDANGLAVEIDLPDTQTARDLRALIARGDVSQMSFGFRTIRQEWKFSDEPGSIDERTLLEVQLFDVSPVAFPAYPDTTIAARSREANRSEARPACADNQLERAQEIELDIVGASVLE